VINGLHTEHPVKRGKGIATWRKGYCASEVRKTYWGQLENGVRQAYWSIQNQKGGTRRRIKGKGGKCRKEVPGE